MTKKKKKTYGLLVREIRKKSTRVQLLWLLVQERRHQSQNPDRQIQHHRRRLQTQRHPQTTMTTLRSHRRLRTKRRRWRERESGEGEERWGRRMSVCGEKGKENEEERVSGVVEKKRRVW